MQEEKTSSNKIISFLSGKGGTGKTSIVTNLGVYLAELGKKVLLVDMDFFTRGLTYYVTKGKTSLDGSIIDILKGQEDAKLTEIRERLFLLPPSVQSLDLTASSEIDTLFQEQKGRFPEVLSKLRGQFDFILVDQRSGIDPLTISSALFSDGYVIVTEEDRTSQRASHLLMNALNDHRRALSRGQKGATFLGFIINMYTTSYGSDLIRFLETSVFDTGCLAAIPHFATVRRTFVRDEIMVEKLPRHEFSKEIRALSETLLGHDTVPPFKRASQRRRKELLLPMAVTGAALYVYAASYIVFRRANLTDLSDLLIPLLPLAFLAIWLYLRRD